MRLATPADVQRIEEVCNHPLIRVWTACDGAPPCSGAQYVTAPSFSVIGEEGCFLAKHLDPGRYAIHTNLLPEHRGEFAVEAAKAALAVAFLQTDAMELVTFVPATIPHARLLARRMGFRFLFNRGSIWPVNGERYGMGFYSLTLDDWIASGACQAAGAAFHDRLHGELHVEAHGHDLIHDSYVGAAIEMIRAGNVRKGIAIYNRWARFAFYESVRIVSEAPLRIDIRQCVLRVEGDQFFMEAQNA